MNNNLKYIGLLSIIILFGIFSLPKIYERVINSDITDSNRLHNNDRLSYLTISDEKRILEININHSLVSKVMSLDKNSKEVMDKYFERTARAFSSIVNLLDPDVIVCGGGMSDIEELYEEVPKRIIPYIASNFFNTPILKSEHGSSSGVRGAALLWD